MLVRWAPAVLHFFDTIELFYQHQVNSSRAKKLWYGQNFAVEPDRFGFKRVRPADRYSSPDKDKLNSHILNVKPYVDTAVPRGGRKEIDVSWSR